MYFVSLFHFILNRYFPFTLKVKWIIIYEQSIDVPEYADWSSVVLRPVR